MLLRGIYLVCWVPHAYDRLVWCDVMLCGIDLGKFGLAAYEKVLSVLSRSRPCWAYSCPIAVEYS